MSLSIRCLATNDIGLSDRLATAATAATHVGGGIGWLREDLRYSGDIARVAEWFKTSIQNPNTFVFVAEQTFSGDVKDQIVGSVLLVRGDPFHSGATRHRAMVSKLFVIPEYRGKGISKLLMMALVKMARAVGLEQLSLDVRLSPAQLAARHLYKSLGFVEFGTQPNYAVENGEHFSGLYMTLDLGE